MAQPSVCAWVTIANRAFDWVVSLRLSQSPGRVERLSELRGRMKRLCVRAMLPKPKALGAPSRVAQTRNFIALIDWSAQETVSAQLCRGKTCVLNLLP